MRDDHDAERGPVAEGENVFAEAEDAYDEFGDDEGEDDASNPEDRVDLDAGEPAEDLRQLVSYLATNLVDDPEGVSVEAVQRGQTVGLTLRVPEEELGKVIGRQGRIARALRTVLTIAGSRHNVRASLDIEG